MPPHPKVIGFPLQRKIRVRKRGKEISAENFAIFQIQLKRVKISSIFGLDWDSIAKIDFDFALSVAVAKNEENFAIFLAPIGSEKNEIFFVKLKIKEFQLKNFHFNSISVEIFAIAFVLFYWRFDFSRKTLLIVQNDEILKEILLP